MSSSFMQSAPLTYTLAALGGVLEVFATAMLAFPDAREKQGVKVSRSTQRLALMGNVVFQILASLSGNLFATWFGPVALVGPIFFSAQLVANMVIFGFILGLENLAKEMQVGTYVIVVSTVLLPVVGPGIQEGQNAQYLLSRAWAIIWSIVLLAGMFGSAIFVFGLLPCTKISNFRMSIKMIILLIARSTCFTLNLTASRVFILDPGITLIVLSIIIKIVSGAIYTWAIVVQSTEVVQSKFVPINATCLMLLNAVTGIIIWEDWKVIASWVGYVCVFLLLALASYLLLSHEPLLSSENPEYGQRAHFRNHMIRAHATRTLNPLNLGPMSESNRVKDGSGHYETNSCKSNDNGSDDKEKDERDMMSTESENRMDENGNDSLNQQNSTTSSHKSTGKEDNDANSVKAEGEDLGGDRDEDNADVSGSIHPIEQDDGPSQTNNDDVEAPSPPPRPHTERSMTRREAWQSIYHLHHVSERQDKH